MIWATISTGRNGPMDVGVHQCQRCLALWKWNNINFGGAKKKQIGKGKTQIFGRKQMRFCCDCRMTGDMVCLNLLISLSIALSFIIIRSISIYLSIRLSICASLSIYLSIHPSIYTPINLWEITSSLHTNMIHMESYFFRKTGIPNPYIASRSTIAAKPHPFLRKICALPLRIWFFLPPQIDAVPLPKSNGS